MINFTREMSSDLTVHACGTIFSLHKFPLVSKCGYIRKLVSKSNDSDVTEIELSEIPGGEQAFELAMKFCYGINFEISSENIAMLRCIAEYLEMTEENAIKNLVGRTEAYLNEVALKSLSAAISILHSCQNFLIMAEEVKLVSRCIDAIAYLACKDDNKKDQEIDSSSSDILPYKPTVEQWAENLFGLRISLFQRVAIALIARGFKQSALGPILMLYAQSSLQGLEKFGMGRKKIEPREEQEKRTVVETVVSLLPREKDTVSISFLSFLLRNAIHLDTTISCRLDLEKRMASQLGQAVLDDLLIPSFSLTGETLFDVETARRIMVNFLENEVEGKSLGHSVEENIVSIPLSELEKVGKLMESYLAEIASDRNLSVSKFVGFAEIIPEQSRVTEDGLYRAIDIYLKAHPTLSETEKKNICSIINCQKLSPEACSHAAQNDRLSVQTILKVLFNEQQRLRETINNGFANSEPSSAIMPPKPTQDEFSRLKRENEKLKLELTKMKAQMKQGNNKSDFGSPSSESNLSSSSSAMNNRKATSRKSFISHMSKKLGRLYPFAHNDENGTSASDNGTNNIASANGIGGPKSRPRRNKRRFSVS